jgi:hypothetical protein
LIDSVFRIVRAGIQNLKDYAQEVESAEESFTEPRIQVVFASIDRELDQGMSSSLSDARHAGSRSLGYSQPYSTGTRE